MKLLYLVEHPIQYQAPLLRLVAGLDDVDLTVLFEHAGSTNVAFDKGFGRPLAWDIPLTDGYDNRVESAFDAVDAAIQNTDVLWLHGWGSTRQRKALVAARRHGVPVLMRGENTLAAMPDGAGLRGWLKRRYLDWIFTRCSGFLCIGSANREYYRTHGVRDDRLYSVPYAVDNRFFGHKCDQAAKTRDAFRLSLGLEPDRPVILYAGKLQRRKNPTVLLEAFHNLDLSRQPYLVIVGDGEQRQEVEQAAKRNSSIHFVGFQNQTELPAFYDLADVFVLASHREPWGLAVNEAMNGGCVPIVSDECGCAADLVTPANGKIVPAGDAAALGSALEAVLKNEAHLDDMKAAARARIVEWGFDQDLAGLSTALRAVGPKPSRS